MQNEYQVEFEYQGFTVTATGNGYDECLITVFKDDTEVFEGSGIDAVTWRAIEAKACEELQERFYSHADALFDALKGN